jgi:4-amino-4-deoxy-L-arabinose transferase-like glycosyltransferase
MNPPQERSSRRRLWFFLVILLAVGARVASFTGEMPPDSLAYAQYAHELAHGTFDLKNTDQYAHRLPLFAPTALLYRWFGISRFTTAAWPLLLSLLGVVCAMVLGERLFGTNTGLLAGLLLALLPLDGIASTYLLPDVPFGVLMGFSGALWLMGTMHPAKRAVGLPYLSGICMGLAAVIRPYALILAAYVVIDALVRRVRGTKVLQVALGSLTVIGGLLLLYGLATGNPLYRAQVVSQVYSSGVLAEPARLSMYPSALFAPLSLTGLHPWFLVLGAILALVWRSKEARSLLLWILVVFCFLEFGSMSLGSYLPILKRLRFLTPLSIPAAVLGAWGVSQLLGLAPNPRAPFLQRRALRNLLRVGAVGVLLLELGLYGYQVVRFRERDVPRYESWRAVVHLAREHPKLPILVDHWRTGIRLAYELRYKDMRGLYHGSDDDARMVRSEPWPGGRIAYLSWYPDPTTLPEGLAVIDEASLKKYGGPEGGRGRPAEARLPAYVFHPPKSWSLLHAAAGVRAFETPSR